MWVDVKQRLIAILQTLPKVGDTNRTIAVSVPQDRSDFHCYLIVVKPSRDTVQRPIAPEINPHNLNFIIECTSPQVNTGIIVENEYRIEAYADAITELFDDYPRLEDPASDAPIKRQALKGVSGNVLYGGAVFKNPTTYPQGGEISHYSFTMNIEIPFKRSKRC